MTHTVKLRLIVDLTGCLVEYLSGLIILIIFILERTIYGC